MRSELVHSAVNFLRDPKVASASLAKRIEFLESKQLTLAEIDRALALAKDVDKSSGEHVDKGAEGHESNGAHVPVSAAYAYKPPPLPQRDWKDYFVMACLTSGVVYGLYEVTKRYVLPLVVPPTTPALAKDKQELEAELELSKRLLAQVQDDVAQMKSAHDERLALLNSSIKEFANLAAEIRDQQAKRTNDIHVVQTQLEAVKSGLPQFLDRYRSQQSQELEDLNSELKSLKQLLAQRLSGGSVAGLASQTVSLNSKSSPALDAVAIPAWQKASHRSPSENGLHGLHGSHRSRQPSPSPDGHVGSPFVPNPGSMETRSQATGDDRRQETGDHKSGD